MDKKNGKSTKTAIIAAAAFVLAIAAALGWRQISRPPQRTDVMRQASENAVQDDWNGVISVLEPYVERNPGDEQAIAMLAQAWNRLGEHRKAADVWATFPQSSPRLSSAILERSRSLFQAEDAIEAELAFLECLGQSDPLRDADVRFAAYDGLNGIFWVQRRKDDIRRQTLRWAREAFASGNSQRLRDAGFWLLRTMLKEMPTEEGIERTRGYIRNAADVDSQRALAYYFAESNRLREARELIDGVLELSPTAESVRTWLEINLRANDVNRVEAMFEWLDKKAAGDRFDRWRAEWLLSLGRVDDATQTLQSWIERNPGDREALAKLVPMLSRSAPDVTWAAKRLHPLNEAIDRLQGEYLRLQQGGTPTADESMRIADWCATLEWHDAAFAWLSHAILLEPNDETIVKRRAEIEPKLHSLAAALEDDLRLGDPSLPPFQHKEIENASVLSTATRPAFRDVAEEAGIDFNYDRGETGRFWIVEANGGGAAWLDADLDGFLDVYFVNGRALLDDASPRSTNRFYQNREGLRFADRTDVSGLGDAGYGQGCAVGDFDNDGFPDVYVTNYGANVLHRNCGDGTFESFPLSTAAAGDAFSTGAAFVDVNGDGILDLYVCNYLDFDPDEHGTPCRNPATAAAEYCGPRCCPPAADVLLLGDDAGGFRDISIESGVAAVRMPGFAVVGADLNDDGRPDLYVANDGESNFLFLNEGVSEDGVPRFREIGVESGAARNAAGAAQGSMGIACGDVNRNGRLDLGVTNYYFEHFTLYRNDGGDGNDAYFTDVSIPSGLAAATRTSMGWGAHFLDFDNDGWLDLFMTNGHINVADASTPYEMPAQLFRNLKDGRFEEISSQAGDFFSQKQIGRGAAFGDFDNDGKEDVLQIRHDGAAALLKNETETDNRVLVLRLVGRRSNRDGYHARVEVDVDEDGAKATLMRELTPGVSYLSSNDPRIRVGLGASTPTSVRIRWPSGSVQDLEQYVLDGENLVIEPLAD